MSGNADASALRHNEAFKPMCPVCLLFLLRSAPKLPGLVYAGRRGYGVSHDLAVPGVAGPGVYCAHPSSTVPWCSSLLVHSLITLPSHF
jgi:hypothetical protein